MSANHLLILFLTIDAIIALNSYGIIALIRRVEKLERQSKAVGGGEV